MRTILRETGGHAAGKEGLVVSNSTYSEEWRKDADLGEFWRLVALAREDRAAFLQTLREMDRRGLIRFAWLFEELMTQLGREPHASHTPPEFSEDAVEDLWEEVVGRGREFYERVIADPARMPWETDASDPSHRIRYDAGNVYFERYGEEIPPHSHHY